MNFKRIFVALVAIFMVSCDEDTIEVFDHAGQYETEKTIINEYLSTHYYDAEDLEIKDIDADQIALIDDDELESITTTYNEVDYTMYSYVYEQGTQESPDEDDTVNIYYKATALDGTVYDESNESKTFLSLTSVIYGWSIGLGAFKAGISNEDDPTLPTQYSETGKGFMIIPSGLAYQNYGSGLISPNETLVFKVELKTTVSAGEDLE